MIQSAWRSYPVLTGWSTTASLSWWPPQGFLSTSVMFVRIHALMLRFWQSSFFLDRFLKILVKKKISPNWFCFLYLQADSQASGFHIRSVLCVPIWNRTHQIIGMLDHTYLFLNHLFLLCWSIYACFAKESHRFWIAWTGRRLMMQIRDCLRSIYEKLYNKSLISLLIITYN